LARAGFRLAERYEDASAECAAWIEVHRNRTYDTIMTGRSLIPLRTQWLSDADLVEVPRRSRLNLDFDMKRALVEPRDSEGVLMADTRPWPTIEEFDRARDDLEAWKRAQRRVLKTVSDYKDMRSWAVQRPSQRAAGSTAQSGRPPLVNAFLRAAVSNQSGLGGSAFITACGWPVNEGTVKDAKRRGKLVLGKAEHLTPEEERFALMVFFARPDCELQNFAAEGSPAYMALERIHEDANEPAYDDDYIPDDVVYEDAVADCGLQVVAFATPHIAHAPPCHGNRNRGRAKLLKLQRGGACAAHPVLGRPFRGNGHCMRLASWCS